MEKVQDRWKKICKLLLKIFHWILGIVLLPLVFTVLALLFIWKNILLRIVVKFLKPKLLSLLNCRDGLYAVDRFWEESRSSLGLIAILNGNVCIDKFREEFTKKVLEAKNSSEPEKKIYEKLTQIPTSFGGYYFWQKANYFLIHEHIRQIDRPIDESGLKKFAGTMMTLPFPNKRPLWEILVFPSFNTNCSAVVIRIHQAVTDPEGLMHLVASLSSNGEIKDSSNKGQIQETCKSTTLEKVGETIKIPMSAYRFCSSLFKFKSANPSLLEVSLNGGGDGIASWNEMHELSYRKVKKSQNLEHSSTVGLSVFLGVVDDFIRSWSSPISAAIIDQEAETPEKIPDIADVQLNNVTRILVPVKSSGNKDEWLTNSQSFTIIEIEKNMDSNNSISRLKQIDSEIKNSLEQKYPEISISILKILSLLPRHILRYITTQFIFGGTIIFQEFRSEIITVSQTLSEEVSESAGLALDLISIGEHELLDLIPLCGLQWSHSAIAVATVKFQDQVTMSMIVNSELLQFSEKQKAVDELVKDFPEELDKIFEDGQDEQGFISIPII